MEEWTNRDKVKPREGYPVVVVGADLLAKHGQQFKNVFPGFKGEVSKNGKYFRIWGDGNMGYVLREGDAAVWMRGFGVRVLSAKDFEEQFEEA